MKYTVQSKYIQKAKHKISELSLFVSFDMLKKKFVC